jgi:hypothetical protein
MNTIWSSLEYSDYVDRLRADWPELADAFAGRDSIEHVLAWMDRRGFPPGSVDIVAQDEFSYDFLIRLEPEARWLVFGVN